jgi:serine protease Do
VEVVSPENRQRYRLGPEVKGVVITAIDAEGPASDKNLAPGDVILEIAQQKVASPADIDAKIDAEAKAGHTAVLLLVNHAGEQKFVGIKLGK